MVGRPYPPVIKGPTVGIDPGLEGGVAYLDDLHTETHRMPIAKDGRIDVSVLCGLFRRFAKLAWEKDLQLILELPQVRAGEGRTSGLTTGINWGLIRGALSAIRLGAEVIEVQPAVWRRAVVGVGQKVKDETQQAAKARRKAEALEACRRLYPKADLVGSTHRSAKISAGIVDAILIGHFGRCR